jgi:hypothetical protein
MRSGINRVEEGFLFKGFLVFLLQSLLGTHYKINEDARQKQYSDDQDG